VRFRYKDSRTTHPQTQKTMTLAATEFMRRFLLHVLTVAPPIARETRPADRRDRYETLTGVSLRACPVCPDGHT
jgi:hypothetical protein